MKLFILFQYFKGHLRGGAACFRLKVRGERLKARSFYRFALNYFYVVRPRAGLVIFSKLYIDSTKKRLFAGGIKKAVIPLIEITALILLTTLLLATLLLLLNTTDSWSTNPDLYILTLRNVHHADLYYAQQTTLSSWTVNSLPPSLL